MPQLRPPEAAKLVLHASAKGDQIYMCKQEAGQFSCTLKAPEAQLFDATGKAIGGRFGGPNVAVRRWQRSCRQGRGVHFCPDAVKLPS
jgi:hypothetical protein